MNITHRFVKSFTITCMACPVQIEGILIDGSAFYFRYRYGTARLGVGVTVDDAVRNSFHKDSPYLEHGDILDGTLDETTLNSLFAELLRLRELFGIG